MLKYLIYLQTVNCFPHVEYAFVVSTRANEPRTVEDVVKIKKHPLVEPARLESTRLY